MPRTYNYAEIATRIRDELGVTVVESTLRGAALEERRRTGARTSRVVQGMPAPVGRVGRRVVFAAGAVEDWLTNHPDRRRRIAAGSLVSELHQAGEVKRLELVQAARSQGLTWREITAAVNTADGTALTLAAIHRRYRSDPAPPPRSHHLQVPDKNVTATMAPATRLGPSGR